jgi:hypothetical protein
MFLLPLLIFLCLFTFCINMIYPSVELLLFIIIIIIIIISTYLYFTFLSSQ